MAPSGTADYVRLGKRYAENKGLTLAIYLSRLNKSGIPLLNHLDPYLSVVRSLVVWLVAGTAQSSATLLVSAAAERICVFISSVCSFGSVGLHEKSGFIILHRRALSDNFVGITIGDRVLADHTTIELIADMLAPRNVKISYWVVVLAKKKTRRFASVRAFSK